MRNLIRDRAQAAQTVVDRLMAAEIATDEALSRTAELMGALPQARIDGRVAAEEGHQALVHATTFWNNLISARGAVIATHQALAETKDRIGLRTVALGGVIGKEHASDTNAVTADIVPLNAPASAAA
ncbi:hypothetical protein [Sphingomonas montanisoli]|uniref:Uncharacterized protein n=1 Tax=Sphingomonas montanisoli TaxID=2606412 RepID=A0A5D9C3S7_9SPHN|nr:hypothetical protein [Sphingomonas montanisoli]TZG25957.1 hypothetical protein FYJ91_13365 [Sphingomonas montanisoli]